ncbi:kinase-like protein [Macrolepiota fuliginosa MF-IS2]|uniref:Kinase-like protein n=1 Tax=Macrolepiota fuliginosa MF-IS2 TaxID=1400762 RepID=A0A9P5XB61_9AGAR|nr:kinase-like protein [Macrolepiota fuliginosa MF-IS2]
MTITSEHTHTESVDISQLTQEDVIIVVMGPTGAGKSTFIQTTTGRANGVGHSLASCTSKVSAVRMRFSDNSSIVLVDTPGFDNTCFSNLEILNIIAEWLKNVRQQDLGLSGILYLHRILDHMGGTLLKDLAMFKKLCGEDFFEQVSLITTMWPEVGGGEQEACIVMEEELMKEHWAEMIARGSRISRFENTKTSAWSILDPIIVAKSNRQPTPGILQLQRELVDQNKNLRDTEAGKQPYGLVEELIKRQNDLLSRTKTEFAQTADPAIIKALLDELSQFRRDREQAVKDKRQPESTSFGKIRQLINNFKLRPAPRRPEKVPTPTDQQQDQELLASLILDIIVDKERRAVLLTELQSSGEAKYIIEVIDDILHGANMLRTDEWKRILSLLRELARIACVFPRCYNLKGVQYDTKPFEAGGFADIYRGRYKGKSICLKIVRVSAYQGDEPQLLSAYAEELALWAHLSHPNVLPLYGVYVDSRIQWPCLVSPWMENGNLCDFLKKDHPRDLRMLLVSDIVNGLCYLHELGIVHCDLKGQNVLVSSDKRAVIADFGISHVATSAIGTASFKGTINWSAPELFDVIVGEVVDGKDYPRPTTASDIWSFGCVFTRRIPFYQVHRKETLMAILMKGVAIPLRPPPDDPDHVEDEMWDLMKKCWNYVPQDRPTCKQLQSFFEGLNLPDNRPRTPAGSKDGHTIWRARKAESKEEADYQRALEILTRIQQST